MIIGILYQQKLSSNDSRFTDYLLDDDDLIERNGLIEQNKEGIYR